MQVVSITAHPDVAAACAQANGLLHNPVFFDAIAAHAPFDQDAHGTPATATPAQISALMQGLALVFQVDMFVPHGLLQKTKYHKTQAYTDPAQPNTLFLNGTWIAQQAPSTAELAATIIHECVHAANTADPDPAHEFGHGDNSSKGKDNTAPYWIGSYAYSLLSGQPMAALVFDDDAEMVA